MDLLSEEIRFIGQKNFGTLDLSQIENQRGNFLGGCARGIRETLEEISERSRLADDAIQDLFLVRLEREGGDLGLPVLQVLQLRTGCIARNLLSPIANRTRVFVELLNFAPSNLKAFTMVPKNLLLVAWA